ncbi:hypothetical protein LEMLEM_LOCUS20379 [Lemmus lemmus]
MSTGVFNLLYLLGCCIPDEDDIPKRRRHFVHGTRTRLWPPSRVEPTHPNDVTLETMRDHFHHHRRSEESIKTSSWNVHRQWDWSSDEEDSEGGTSPRSPRLSSGPWCSRDFRRPLGERRSGPGACRLAGEDAARTCKHPERRPLLQPQPQRDPRTRRQRLLNFPL